MLGALVREVARSFALRKFPSATLRHAQSGRGASQKRQQPSELLAFAAERQERYGKLGDKPLGYSRLPLTLWSRAPSPHLLAAYKIALLAVRHVTICSLRAVTAAGGHTDKLQLVYRTVHEAAMSGTIINLNFSLGEVCRIECIHSFVAPLTLVAHEMSPSLEGQLRERRDRQRCSRAAIRTQVAGNFHEEYNAAVFMTNQMTGGCL